MAKAETQKPETEAPASKPAPRNVTCPLKNIQRTEYVQGSFTAYIPEGHTPEDILRPVYWAHKAREITRNSEIKCIADNYAWGCTLLVTFSDGKTVHVIPIHKWEGEVVLEVGSSDLKIMTGASGFRVVEKATGKVLAEDIPTRKQANDKLAELDAKRAA